MLTLALALLAGLLTSLSPCVLPALPLVVGSARLGHRAGPLALIGGMIASFVVLGVTLASAGGALGLDALWIRRVAAVGLVAAGVFLWSTFLQDRLSTGLAPLTNWAARRSGSSLGAHGLGGQVAIGALLGALWSPCTGPTLGAAVGLAAQGSVPRAALVMLAFGVGAGLPLLGAAYATRAFGSRLRLLGELGGRAKKPFAAILVAVGVAVAFGLDKRLEALLLDRLPDGWIDLVTRF